MWERVGSQIDTPGKRTKRASKLSENRMINIEIKNVIGMVKESHLFIG